ncbi:MAG: hypothetical protein ACFB15_07420 [Cyclobacteriaceae bacterium]
MKITTLTSLLLVFITFNQGLAFPVPERTANTSNQIPGFSVELMEPFRATTDHLQQKLRKARRKRAFLRYMFYYIHRKHLKRYKQYSLLTDVMKNGSYDCVSGSALYALMLEEYGFSYQIWEMDYHVYLTVSVDDMTFVLETTDPVHGFIELPKEIAEHREYYEQQAELLHQEAGSNDPLIHRSITLTQLAGLLLYNRAINAWNNRQQKQAQQFAAQALDYYPAERIACLAQFIAH